MKTLRDFQPEGKRVLVRCDFNVPVSKEGVILDDFRIRQTLPTIEYLLKKGAKVVLMSHLGSPGGRVVEALSLKPVGERLEALLGQKINLLENLRFNPGEEGNEENFAKKLAGLGDIYINDAFGACHRSHASIVGVPKFLPSGAGFLLEREIEVLSSLRDSPREPLIAIIGGAKVEKKAKLINKFSELADFVLIGGLIQKEAREKNIQFNRHDKIIEPVDETGEGKDIGPKTIGLFKGKISFAKTVFWNGPLGEIEKEEFTEGTKAIAQAIVESGAFSVVGGGETVYLFQKIGLTENFNHISTGGGAMLEFLSGRDLPGIKALK